MDKIVESLIRKDYVEAKSLIESALGEIALNRINEMRNNRELDLGKVKITNLVGTEIPPETPSMGPGGEEARKIHIDRQKESDEPNVFDAVETLREKHLDGIRNEMEVHKKGIGYSEASERHKSFYNHYAGLAFESHGENATAKHAHELAMAHDRHYPDAFRAAEEHGVPPEKIIKKYWEPRIKQLKINPPKKVKEKPID